MSFFGFDTSLPRDKPGAEGKGIFEHTNPFTEVAKARKLQAFHDNEEEMYVTCFWETRFCTDILTQS